MATVAVDLLGGDGAPAVVADAIAGIVAAREPLDLVVVGPADHAQSLLGERGIDLADVRIVDAGCAAAMSDDPIATLRARDDLTVSVAARLVRDGAADAWVSVGHTGSAVAAAALVLGRLEGMHRPALAVIVPALNGPVVLLDVGATQNVVGDDLASHAVAGWAYARQLGISSPRVGLLTIGAEAGKGDALRKATHDLLARRLPVAGIDYVGPVEGNDVSVGARADVIVTDGFTGNVLLKGLEGAVRWAAARIGALYPDPLPARSVPRAAASSDFAGAVLLGVNEVTVVGHGAGTAEEIRACIRLAARSADLDLAAATAHALAVAAAA